MESESAARRSASRVITEQTHRLVSHEAAHAILGHMQGLTVGYVSRDRSNSGHTLTIFSDDDPRTVREKAFVRAIICIGAVRYESGIIDGGQRLFCADHDVEMADAYAEQAGSTVEAASARARDLTDSEVFRVLHAKVVDALLHQPYLDARAFAKLVR